MIVEAANAVSLRTLVTTFLRHTPCPCSGRPKHTLVAARAIGYYPRHPEQGSRETAYCY